MRLAAAILLVFTLWPACAEAQAGAGATSGAPAVLASIKPLHSIAAAVMEGAGTPELLLTGGANPHSYALRPSDAAKIARAQVIFWVGPEMEEFLHAPLASLAGDARIVALDSAPGIVRLPARRGGLWEADHDEHEGNIDGHLWLDPENAAAIANAMAEALGAADAAHAALYKTNADRFAARMASLTTALDRTLAPVRTRPYIVFHDAYHYLENRFRLSPAGAVAVAADRPVGARRVADIRARIRDAKVPCVIAPPEFRPALVRTLTEGTPARVASVDVLGVDLAPGPALYETMLTAAADAITACLR
jgi:zinc transport system substrate-binding protein